MTEKEIRQVLFEYKNHGVRMRDLKDEMAQVRSDIERFRTLSAVRLDGMPKGYDVGDPTGEAAAYIVDVYEKRLKELKDRVRKELENKAVAEKLLSVLDETERKVIVCRYIKGIRWDHMGAYVFLSRRSCFYYKKRAMEKMMGVEVFCSA